MPHGKLHYISFNYIIIIIIEIDSLQHILKFHDKPLLGTC